MTPELVEKMFSPALVLCDRPGFRSVARGKTVHGFRVVSGEIAICEPIWPRGRRSAHTSVTPGEYPVFASIVETECYGTLEYQVAAARLDLSSSKPVRWKRKGSLVVDAASAAFIDASLKNEELNEEKFQEEVSEKLIPRNDGFVFKDGKMVAFHLESDGKYPVFEGLDASGGIASLLMSFEELQREEWASIDVPLPVLGKVHAPLLARKGIEVEGIDLWKSRKIDVRNSVTLRVHSYTTTISMSFPLLEVVGPDGRPLPLESDTVNFMTGRFHHFSSPSPFAPDSALRLSFLNRSIKVK